MNYFLKIVEGQKKGAVFSLQDKQSRTIIGRDPSCHIQIHDNGVSRKHFCVLQQEGKFFLQDMGSSNGTLVNNHQTLWQEIRFGDVINCGGTCFEFFSSAVSPNNLDQSKIVTQELSSLKQTGYYISRNHELAKLAQGLKKIPAEEAGAETETLGDKNEKKAEKTVTTVKENPLDIICQRQREEPPFSEEKDIESLRKTLSTVYRVLELLNSQLELGHLLEVIIENALEITNGERGCLILKKSENAPAETTAFHSIHTVPSNIPISNTVVNLALEKGIATVSSDALSDKALCQDSSSIIIHNIRSVMCVPLEGRNKILGAIYVDNLFTRNFFDDKELELLRAIGKQAGLAIERALLQEAIRQSEQKYRTIFEKSPFCLFLVSSYGRVLDMNPSSYAVLSLKEDPSPHYSVLDFFPNAKQDLQNLLQYAKCFDIKEIIAETKKGKSIFFHIQGIPLLNEKGECEGGMIIAQDITESKRFQSQMLRQEKMSTIGLLGASLAHELNNIIAGMMGYAQLIQKRKGENCEDGLAKVVVEQCKRARDVVDRLLNFSRAKDGSLSLVKLEDLVEDTFQLVSRELVKNKITFLRKFEPNLPQIKAVPGQLQQVFLNIMINASQAMPKGGSLTISIWKEDKWIRIAFEDTGTGIASKHLPNIFEPFFTTKGNHGTGLGLAVSFSIIQEYGGEITVQSKENEGSVFTVHLPYHE